MARLYLIRHGKPRSNWHEDLDPSLDEEGVAQAEDVARRVSEMTGRACPIWTSPKLRCQETAKPLSRLWEREARVVPELTEIPSPVADNATSRSAWLRQVLSMRWSEFLASPDLTGEVDFAAWRRNLIETVKSADQDSVFFTHFVAINMVMGHVHQDDRAISCLPAHCSVWIFDTLKIEGTGEARITLHGTGNELEGARLPLADRHPDVR